MDREAVNDWIKMYGEFPPVPPIELVRQYCGRDFDRVPPAIEKALVLTMDAGYLTTEAKQLCDLYRVPPGFP